MPEAGELYLLPKRENNWHLNNVVDELRHVRQAWRDEHSKITIVINAVYLPVKALIPLPIL